MNKDEIKKWLDDNLRKGYTIEEIESYLKSKNYPQEYIDYIDKNFRNRRFSIKEHSRLLVTLVVLSVILFSYLYFEDHVSFLSREFGDDYESQKNHMINCISEKTEENSIILSWFDWADIIESGGRKPLIDNPSKKYLPYMIEPNIPEDDLTDSELMDDVALAHSTPNFRVTHEIMKKYDSKYILLNKFYNQGTIPILLETTNTTCKNEECTFAYKVSEENLPIKNECFETVCENYNFLLLKDICI